ncbi:MAG: translation initiation factor IF-2 [Actinobacteria bacterium]|nr:translation initiation factor IF-2 [Actinomycetota bacterium]
MSEKKRIYEIAKEEGLPSANVLQRLQRAGMNVKTASSTVDVAWAMHILSPNRHPKPEGEMPQPEPRKKAAPRKKKVEAPAEEPAAEAAAPEAVEAPEVAPGKPAPARKAAPAAAVEPVGGEAPAPAAEADPVDAAAVEKAAPAAGAPAPAPAPAPPAAEEDPAPAAAPPAAEAPAAGPRGVAEDKTSEVKERIPPKRAPEKIVLPAPRRDPRPPPPPLSPPPPEAAPPRSDSAGPSGSGVPGDRGRSGTLPPRGTGGIGRPDGADGRGRKRRVVIDAQAGRRQGGGGRDRRDRRGAGKEHAEAQVQAPVNQADLPRADIRSGATVKDIAETLGIPTAQIIKFMMTMGELVTITQSMSDDAIELIAADIERKISIIHAEEEPDLEVVVEDDPADLTARAPVVTVMGHVDHGKTSLLDAIRRTEVAAGEAGGITQHIGAYQVHHNEREVTFLDTPGHEAFTAMRARGAKITDVAVIVVAADDGVMPQTIEAIDHAKAAEVPFVVAINKIDKDDANPDKVKQELSSHEVIPTDWGGGTEFVNVSAQRGDGLEDLLETVLLVADADADPRANPGAEASGTVVESRLDPGRGPVCTLLVQRGTMRVGEVVVVGETFGRVRAMLDYNGEPLEAATPSVPVEILGLDGVPDAGEKFRVVDNERTARQIASVRSQRLRTEELANRRPVSLEDLFARVQEGGLKELNLIIKGDVQGSVGALEDALNKVEQTEVRLRIIHTGVGAVNESDVMLAAASQAIIIGFNVRPRPEAKMLAEREGVDVRTYRVIYRAIEDIRDALVGMLEPDIVEEPMGALEVRATFKASRLGTIAGCYVTEGAVRRGANCRLVRDGTVVFTGKVASLRRIDEDVREVQQGFECGVLLEDYNDVKEGDEIEVFELKEVARTAQAAAPPPAAAPATAEPSE